MTSLPRHPPRAEPRHRAPHHHPVLLALAVLAVVAFGGGAVSMVWTRDAPGDRAPTSSGSTDLPPEQSPDGAPDDGAAGSAGLEATLEAARTSPMEAVALTGHVDGVEPGTELRVQLRDRERRWTSFPLRPVVDDSGHFETYVELGARGVHELRVLEPASDLASDTLTLRVR